MFRKRPPNSYPHQWVDEAVTRAAWTGGYYGFLAGASLASLAIWFAQHLSRYP